MPAAQVPPFRKPPVAPRLQLTTSRYRLFHLAYGAFSPTKSTRAMSVVTDFEFGIRNVATTPTFLEVSHARCHMQPYCAANSAPSRIF